MSDGRPTRPAAEGSRSVVTLKLAAFLGAVILVTVSVAGCGGGGDTKQSEVDPEFVTWAEAIPDWATKQTAATAEVNRLLRDGSFTRRVLTGDASAARELSVPLKIVAACDATLPQTPDNPDALRIKGLIEKTCDAYANGAKQLSAGLGNLDENALTAADLDWRVANIGLDAVLAAVKDCLKREASCSS